MGLQKGDTNSLLTLIVISLLLFVEVPITHLLFNVLRQTVIMHLLLL